MDGWVRRKPSELREKSRRVSLAFPRLSNVKLYRTIVPGRAEDPAGAERESKRRSSTIVRTLPSPHCEESATEVARTVRTSTVPQRATGGTVKKTGTSTKEEAPITKVGTMSAVHPRALVAVRS
jgi:hypothetical protein